MDMQAWGEQRARYSRARRGRHERGAAVGECALIQAAAEAKGLRLGASAGRAAAAAVARANPATVEASAA